MTLTPQWLDELRARTTLSALIGRTVKITKAGREFKACCPFHNEKTPSFTINDEKGFYHCFGCSAHGDAIRWMTDQRGLSFMDAIKELASEAGMDVPAPDPKTAEQAEARAGLHDVMAAAQDWFVDELNGIEGANARAYLESRGLTKQTIEDFGFGFAPDSRAKLKRALSRYEVTMLVEAGLLIAVDEKEPYDRFRGRLMIPIRDPRGRVIAFGGRILGDGEPKYLNSPDTPLFDKGRTLYNLDKCSPASRQTGRVIVVEGYMDVIAIAQVGFGDAVAPLGTALTEQQIQMLWRMTEKPLLCFDGDAAGQNAALRAALRALPLLKPGHSLQFVTLSEGQDPDDLVKRSGRKALADLLDGSEPLVERLWRSEVAAGPLATPEDRAGLKQRLGVHLSSITDAEIRRHYADAFRERFDTLFASKARAPFQPGFPAKKGPQRDWRKPQILPPGTETKSFANGPDDKLVNAIIGALVQQPGLALRHLESLTDLPAPNKISADLLQAILDEAFRKETLDTEALLTILPESLYNVAKRLIRSDVASYALSGSKLLNAVGEQRRIAEDVFIEAVKLAKLRPRLLLAVKNAEAEAYDKLSDESLMTHQRLVAEFADFERSISDLFKTEDGL